MQEHRRRSIRLKDYDYSQEGAYFVTICSHNREEIFKDEPYRKIVEKYWFDLPRHYPRARLDEFVIMSNHMHAIIILVGAGSADRTAPVRSAKPARSQPNRAGLAGLSPAEPAPTIPNAKRHSLSEIIRFFKTYSAREINRMRRTPRRPVGQRNYYEHIIRNQQSMNKICEYIIANALQWELDWDNPVVQSDLKKRNDVLKTEADFWDKIKN